MKNQFYLISKIEGEKFVKYKGDAVRLTSRTLPYSVDEVVLGIKGQIGKERKITTFRDSKGNIIERIFDYFDKPLKNRIYREQEHVIGEEEIVKAKTVREYSISKPVLKIYKECQKQFAEFGIEDSLWNKEKIDTFYLAENINTGEKVLSQVSIKDIEHPRKELHSFIEYPHTIDGKLANNNKKSLSFRVNTYKQEVVPGSEIADNVKTPKKDSFLAYRALDIDDAQEPFAKRFIKERKLEKLKLLINKNYIPEEDEKGLIALYLDYNGSINYNKFYKFKSKSKLAGTTRHEVEHAWQYYLRARYTGGDSLRTQEIAKKFGRIKTKQMQTEAEKYTHSINNYVPFTQDFELYKKNLIEIHANKQGNNAEKQYDREGKEIRKAFPHIPPEML